MSGPSTTGGIEDPLANYSNSDPHLEFEFFLYPFNTEGTWRLVFHIRWSNCYEQLAEGLLPDMDMYKINTTNIGPVVFTTKGPSKQIDLVAATSNQTCSAPAGVAINITDTMDTPAPHEEFVDPTKTQYSLAMFTKVGVPSNKVILGVTSFGRSYKMTGAGCNGPDYFYNGDKLESPAKKGKCTGTGGYIADAEIKEILKEKSCVTKHYVDTTSHSDILIYDNTEWVSYMRSNTKLARELLYSAWGMGGTTNWATDLQTYHDVPKPAKNWTISEEDVSLGDDPKLDKVRTGNWTDYYCECPIVEDKRYFVGKEYERWSLL
ncbi:hypothetical protein ACHAPJ_012619 [Fusarium lateritium]